MVSAKLAEKHSLTVHTVYDPGASSLNITAGERQVGCKVQGSASRQYKLQDIAGV